MNDRDRPRVAIAREHCERRNKYGRDEIHTSTVMTKYGPVLVTDNAPPEFVAGLIAGAQASYYESKEN